MKPSYNQPCAFDRPIWAARPLRQSVVEVDRSDRQDRRRMGKSDPLDAVSAARAAQSGRAPSALRGHDGTADAIRALVVARLTDRDPHLSAGAFRWRWQSESRHLTVSAFRTDASHSPQPASGLPGRPKPHDQRDIRLQRANRDFILFAKRSMRLVTSLRAVRRKIRQRTTRSE